MQNKKIGILTFQDTLNYGASMQCYALQKKLQLMGADAEVINYKCPKFVKEYSPFYISKLNVKKFLYMIFAFKMNVIKQRKKIKFQNANIQLSKKYTPDTISLANQCYDIFITGSDQVWNWHLTGFDKTFFLDFVEKEKEKCSYAASFGISEIEQDKSVAYSNLLSNFNYISVREKSAQNILSSLIKRSPEIVVDPVFLLSSQQWKQVLICPQLENYVVLYSINDTKAYECAKELAKQTGKTLVYLSAPLKKHGNFLKITNIGPDEFVGWISNADYVITDSFHGVATSILFHKQFIALQDRRKIANANARIWDLLFDLNLTNRIIQEPTEIDKIFEQIDFEQVQDVLDVNINKSVLFLEKIIGNYNEE